MQDALKRIQLSCPNESCDSDPPTLPLERQTAGSIVTRRDVNETMRGQRLLAYGPVALFFLVEALGHELLDQGLVTLVPAGGKVPDPLEG